MCTKVRLFLITSVLFTCFNLSLSYKSFRSFMSSSPLLSRNRVLPHTKSALGMGRPSSHQFKKGGAHNSDNSIATKSLNMQNQLRNSHAHCEGFGQLPFDCRSNGCVYDCADDRCTYDIADTVACSASGCEKFCFDPCGCRQTDTCYYDSVNNRCRRWSETCSEGFFNFTKGYTPGKFYFRAGIPCENTDHGKDNQITTHFGVNLGGGARHVSANGFEYDPEDWARYADPHHTKRLHERAESDVVKGPADDLVLYDTYISGNDAKRKAGRCLTYFVKPMSQGNYQACIKTAEMVHFLKHQRSFNVRFNNQLVIHELDIVELAGGRHIAIDACFLFHVNHDSTWMTIHGLPPTQIVSSEVPLSFCYGRCDEENEASYIVAAIHVGKLTN